MAAGLLPTLQAKRSQDKVEFLDGLRGLACVIVAIYHYHLAFGCILNQDQKEFWNSPPVSLIKSGMLAVEIFFIISGRVIAESFRKKPSLARMGHNMFKRAFRLGLPVLAIFIWNEVTNTWIQPLQWLNYETNSKGLCNDMGHWVFEYVLPISRSPYEMLSSLWIMFIKGIHPVIQAGVLWTIPIEFQQSFTVYSLSLVASTIRWKWTTLVLVFLIVVPLEKSHAISFIFGYIVSEFEDTRVFEMICGWERKRYSPLWFLSTIFKVCIGLLGYAVYAGLVDLRQMSYQKEFVAPALILLAISMSQNMRWFFSTTPLRFLGRISFALYLIHGTMLPYAHLLIAQMIRAGIDKYTSFCVILWCAFLPLAALVSWIFYHVADKPSVQFTRLLQNFFFDGRFPELFKKTKDFFLNYSRPKTSEYEMVESAPV